MSKRKHVDAEDLAPDTPSKRSRKKTQRGDGLDADNVHTTPLKSKSTPSNSKTNESASSRSQGQDRSRSPTPRANGVASFATPKKSNTTPASTPSKTKRADQSAKRKSVRRLAEVADEDDWDGENVLATAILDEEIEENERTEPQDPVEVGESTPSATPSKRGRGRPKGSKNKRSPTPEGDIAPEERYFFQNRAGPPQYSTNSFSTVKLLTHDEYFEQMSRFQGHHQPEKAYLMKLHTRSFPQWKFEFSQRFSICLYGFGSKRQLINKYAEWLQSRSNPQPKIIIVNGYTPKLSIRNILATIASTLVGEDERLKLTGSPQEMLDTLLSHLAAHPPSIPLVVMVNSIDAPSLRKTGVQSILSRLSAHPLVNLIATADTPNFPLMWNSALLDQFKFVFHDGTIFAPYEAEISVVDEVYDLLGRKGRRMGGKDGIGFVLKSLPPNARNLYRILLSEILAILNDDLDPAFDEAAESDGPKPMRQAHEGAEDVGIEYRLLYQKASEEFICSSDINFRFLLKEFHDHQMITSRRDVGGTEVLCVPLGKEDMQAVLEDLVVS